MGELIFRSDESVSGGYEGILKVRGVLKPLDKQPSRFKDDDGNPGADQVTLVLDDTEVLAMKDGAAKVELSDGIFKQWYNYAKAGQIKPSSGGAYNRALIMSAEASAAERAGVIKDFFDWYSKKKAERDALIVANPEIQNALQKLQGEVVTMEKREIPLGFQDKQTQKDVVREYFVFINDGAAVAGLDAHVKGLLTGKLSTEVFRAVAMDARTKHNVELTSLAREDAEGKTTKLLEKFGLKLDEKDTVVEG